MGVASVVVVDAVCYVGGFLNFEYEIAAAYAVDASCGQEEYVALTGVVAAQAVDYAVVGHGATETVGIESAGESGVEVCAFCGENAVPHLGLAERAVMASGGKVVVGVNLYGEVVGRIDEFD